METKERSNDAMEARELPDSPWQELDGHHAVAKGHDQSEFMALNLVSVGNEVDVVCVTVHCLRADAEIWKTRSILGWMIIYIRPVFFKGTVITHHISKIRRLQDSLILTLKII